MDTPTGRRPSGSRCVALVGPYLSGKTTLLEAILFLTGAIPRQGRVSDKSSVGDAAPEARFGEEPQGHAGAVVQASHRQGLELQALVPSGVRYTRIVDESANSA